MMAERVHHSAEQPAVLLVDGPDLTRPSRYRLCMNGFWIGHDQHHARGPATNGLRTEVLMVRGFVRDPKFGVVDCQLSDDLAVWRFDLV